MPALPSSRKLIGFRSVHVRQPDDDLLTGLEPDVGRVSVVVADNGAGEGLGGDGSEADHQGEECTFHSASLPNPGRNFLAFFALPYPRAPVALLAQKPYIDCMVAIHPLSREDARRAVSEADAQLLTFAGIVAVLGSAAAFLFTFNIYLIPLVVVVCAVATGIGMFGNHLRFKTRRSSER